MRTWNLLLGLCLLLSSGCERRQTDAGQARRSGATDSNQHATGDVVPGSYEDWCGEHEVPETLCTRCNVDLIPAFQASGDWCAEHGIPESQCLACNPGLQIVRPPKPGDE